MSTTRENWIDNIDDVIRSRHYTWIPRGLGGEPVDEAMVWLVTDIMHICERAGADWEDVLQRGRARFRQERTELLARGSVPQE